MRNALLVQRLTLLRSPVGVIGTLVIVGGTLAILGGITAALAAGDPQLTAKLGPSATRDWAGLLASAAQVTSAGGLVGVGVVLAWTFAREFTDGTVGGLYAVPVGLRTTALAKLLVWTLWAAALALTLTAALLGLGLVLGYGVPDATTWAALGRQLGLGVLTAAVAAPVAWVATVTRSLLAGVAATVGLVVVAQVGVLVGLGAWVPMAAPALWAMSGGELAGMPHLALTVLLAVAFGWLTCRAWGRMELDAG